MRILLSDLAPSRIQAIEARMRPGCASTSGFLGIHDTLAAVVERDEETCRGLGITPEQIADRLEVILARAFELESLARRGWPCLPPEAVRSLSGGCRPFSSGASSTTGPGVPVEGHFRVWGTHWRGLQDCPFETADGVPCPDGSHASYDLRIMNLEQGLHLDLPGLIIHLIRDHHFFEGSVCHRVDPGHAARVLGVEASVSYAPPRKREAMWKLTEGTSTPYDALDEKSRRRIAESVTEPDAILEPAEGVRIYLKGDRCTVLADRAHQPDPPLTIHGIELETRGVEPGTWAYWAWRHDPF